MAHRLNSIGLLPNFEAEEFSLVDELLAGKKSAPELDSARVNFRTGIKELYPVSAGITLVDSARSAFYLLLRELKLPADSEVILPGFTCVVIVNPVKWAGLKPVYVDVDPDDFNTPVESLVAAVTGKTKLILVQHTFGKPVDVVELRRQLAKIGRDDILIVEDLAHSFGDGITGIHGDFAVATFGYEKVISTIRGGVLIINNKNMLTNLHDIAESLPEFPVSRVRKLLRNAQIWNWAIPTYYFGIGKLTLGRLIAVIGRKLGYMAVAIDTGEYSGEKPGYLPAKLAPELAMIGQLQLGKLQRFQKQRLELTEIYFNELKDDYDLAGIDLSASYLRFPLLLETRQIRNLMIARAKEKGFILGDWYKTPFYTDPKYLKNLDYELGQCPQAEAVAERVINLPTSVHTTSAQALTLTSILKS